MPNDLHAVPETVNDFPVRVTLEDQVAIQMRCLRMPAMRAGHRRREVLAVLLSPLYILGSGLVGVVISWVDHGMEYALGPAVLELVQGNWPAILAASLGTMTLVALWIVLAHRLARPRMRRILRRVLQAHPGVDKSDPLLAYTSEVGAGPEGVQARSAAGTTMLSWAVLKQWEEIDGRLFVLGDAMTGICLSTREVDPERLGQLRRLLTARLGRPEVR